MRSSRDRSESGSGATRNLPSNSFINRFRKITWRIREDPPVLPDYDLVYCIALEYVNSINVEMLESIPINYEPLIEFQSFIKIIVQYLDKSETDSEIDTMVLLQCLYVTVKGLRLTIDFTNEPSLLNAMLLIAKSDSSLLQSDFTSILINAIIKNPNNKQILFTHTFFLLTLKKFFCNAEFKTFIDDNFDQINSIFRSNSIDLDTSYVVPFFLNSITGQTLPFENVFTAIKFLLSFLKMNVLQARKALDETFTTQNGFSLILNLLISAAPQKIKFTFFDLATLSSKAEQQTINYIIHEIENPNQKMEVVVQLYSTITMIIGQKGFTSEDIEFITDPSPLMRPHQEMDEEMKTCTCFLFNRLCAIGYKYVKQCVGPLIDNFIDQINDQHCEWITEGLVLAGRGLISSLDLKSANFLDVFLVVQSPSFIAHIFEIFPKLTPFLAATYGCESDIDKKFIIISQLLHSQQYFKDQTKFLNSFAMFIIEDKDKNVSLSKLMDMCFNAMTDEILLAISYVFMQDENTCLAFLTKCDGLRLLDSLIKTTNISDENKALFLEALTTGGTSMIISDWILTLETDHPLFRIDAKLLWNIIFYDDGKTICIRVPALIPFIECPNINFGPGDTYLIYSKALKGLTRRNYSIDLTRTITAITNRYISIDEFYYIIQDSKRLAPFVNEHLDHFALFEFQPFKKESYIHIQLAARALAFWIKTEIPATEPIQILNTGALSITLLNGTFTVQYQNNIYGVMKVDSLDWVFIHIAISNELLKNVIYIAIGQKLIEIVVNDPIDNFTSFTFGSVSDPCRIRWFMGPGIRLFGKNYTDRKKIEEMGVGSIELTNEIEIFTPYTKDDQIFGKACFRVPYRSFSSFLTQPDRLMFLVKRAMDANGGARIFDTLRTLIISNAINGCGGDTFWPIIKSVLKRKHEALKDTDAFETIVTMYYNQCIEYFAHDVELWELYTDKMCTVALQNDMQRQHLATHAFIKINNNQEQSQSLLTIIAQNGNYSYLLNLFYICSEQLQLYILEDLININSLKFNPEILNVFTFEKVVSIMLTAVPTVTRRALDLVALLSSGDSSYIKSSRGFCVSLMRTIDSESLQNTLCSLLTGTFGTEILLTNMQVNRPQVIPALLFIIFISISADFAMYGDPDRIEQAVQYFENQLCEIIQLFRAVAMGYGKNFVGTNEVLDMICWTAPWMFDLQILKQFSGAKNNTKPNEKLMRHQIFTTWGLPDYLETEVVDCGDSRKILFSVHNDIVLSTVINIIKKCAPTYDDKNLPMKISRIEPTVTQFLFDIINSFGDKNMLLMAARCLSFVDARPTPLMCTKMLRKFIAVTDVNKSYITFDLMARVHFRGSIMHLREISVMISELLVSKEFEDVPKSDKIIACIRVILYSILDTMPLEESLSYILQVINNRKLSDTIFADDRFTLLFVERLCQFASTNNPSLIMTVSRFVPFVSSRKSCESYVENLPLILQGVALIDTPEFQPWLAANKEIYMNGVEKMHRFFGDFDDLWVKMYKDHDFKTDVLVAMLEVNTSIHDFVNCAQKYPSILETVTNIIRDDSMRRIEEEEMHMFYMINNIELSHIERNCYIMGMPTLPGETPLMLTPSPINLPRFDVGTSRPELYTHTLPEQKIFVEKGRYRLYNDKYTVFATAPTYFGDSSFLPIRASEVMLFAPRILFYTFLNKFKSNPLVFSCKFLKYSDPINAVCFIDQQKACILIGASISNNVELRLEKDYISPICYSALTHQMTLGLFGKMSLFCGQFVIELQRQDVMLVKKRTYNYQNGCVEIHTWHGTDFNLIFHPNAPQLLLSYGSSERRTINPKLFNTSLSNLTDMWQNNSITTYNYLLGVNFSAGRSFSDYSQYFVFPWVISQYGAVAPDYRSEDDIRDLTKPMGMIGEERAKNFIKQRQEKKLDFIFPSHYSMSSSVHHFLLRCPPHTLLEWDIHNGWEVSTKTFNDVSVSWKNSSALQFNDVKELIPEFFALPDMLINRSNLNTRDVILPKWAGNNPCHFVMTNREILNTVDKIPAWIDMIFGVTQSGSSAEHINNIFDPSTYAHKLSSDEDRKIAELAVSTFGQCPVQIFRRQHPSRNPQKPHNDFGPSERKSSKTQPSFSPLEDGFKGVSVTGRIKITPSDACLIVSTAQTAMKCYDNIFVDAGSISVSEDGNALALDDVNNVAHILYFEVIDNNNLMIRKLGSKVFEKQVKTRIESSAQVAVSYSSTSYIIWDPRRGTNIEMLHLPKILDVVYLDKDMLMAVLTPKSLMFKTYTNTDVGEIHFDREASCMVKFNEGIFVGYSDGMIDGIRIDRVNCDFRTIRVFERQNAGIKKLVKVDESVYAWTNDDQIISIV